MKKLVTLLFLGSLLQSFSQTPFTPVEKHGFSHWPSDAINADITDIKAFKGHLYVATGSDSGYVYNSPSGDMATFFLSYANYGVNFCGKFNVTQDNGGYMFMATSNNYSFEGSVLRTDGSTWNYYYSNYYDEVMNITSYKGLQSFDSVYLAIRNSVGNNILLRNSVTQNDPYNSFGTWDTIADVASSFGTAGSVVGSAILNGTLYYACNDNSLFQTTDGRSLQYNNDFYNQIGYGSASGIDYPTALETFGSYMYIGTRSFGGAQIWRTADGITFDSVGVINPFMLDVREMKVAGGKLYVIVRDFSDNYEIYSTTDGLIFTLEDNTSLGTPGTSTNNASPMEEFNDHLYVGVSHTTGGFRINGAGGNEVANAYTEGGKVFRTCLVGTMPTVTITEPDTNLVCQGASFTLNATGATDYLWSNANTSSSLSTNSTGHFGVTTIDGVTGCRSSDDAYIKNYPVVYPHVLDSVGTWVSVAEVCSGDTSGVFKAVDPLNDYNCIVSTGNNDGLVTPAAVSFTGSDFTIEAWIFPQSDGVIASIYDPSLNWSYNENKLMEIQGSNQLHINLENIGSAYVGYVIPNYWNHVVLRYNSATQIMDGFANGVQGGTTNVGNDFLPPSFYTYPDAFKFMNSADYPYFVNGLSGKIRDIRIWNVARTNTEITDNMNNLPAGTYPNLIFHYQTLETLGSVAADASGNNNDATVAGTFATPTPIAWVPAPGLNAVGFNTAEFFPTTPTMYAMQYTDTYGCTVTDSFKVEPRAIHVYGSPAASCGGDPAMLAYSFSSGFYNPTWSSTTLGSVSGFSVTVTPPSDEWVYATDTTGGCVVSDSILVKVGPAFVSGLGTEPPINACENTDVVLHAMASGGTAPYTITWYSSFDTDTTNVDSIVYNVGSSPVNLYVGGYDGIGCQFQAFAFNGFNINPIPSTDLMGHVTSIAPADIDNGFVYIFKHQPGNAGFDTVGYTSLDANGWYNFSPLTAGDYLIKTLPDETAFPNAVPTYYGNAFQWDSSLVYTHGCLQNDTASIVIVETDGTTGTASVSGYIIEQQGFGNNRYGNNGGINNPFVPGGPLKGIDVKLGKNPGGGIQARTTSDTTGFYQFENVPAGGYRIYVDIPNLPMDTTREIMLAAGDSSIQNNYNADSVSIYINITTIGLKDISKHYENKFTAYPNPASSVIYLNYELKEKANVSFEIMNTMGQTMMKEPVRRFPAGENTFVLDLTRYNLNSGVYFVSLISEGHKYTQRIVIIE